MIHLITFFTTAVSLASPYFNMQSLCNSKNHGHQMLVSSPRCSLNCQALSIHLPPLGDKRVSSGNNYLSPPMSGSFDRSTFDDPAHHHPNNSHRQYSLTPPSRPSTSDKSDTRAAQVKKGLGKDVRINLTTPNSTDRETSGTSLHFTSDTHGVLGESNDEISSNAHDSPEGQLVAGPPGIARRAKAHVPSACVNCKKKHLACETKRPCNRCVQTGKEVSGGLVMFQIAVYVLTRFRLAVLTCNTRSEAGRASEKKTTSEKWPSVLSIPTANCIQVKLVVSRIPSLTVADRRLTESCARNPKHPLPINGRGHLILRSHNSSTCKEQHPILYLHPPVISSTSIFRLCCSRPISLWPSTIALSAMHCRCHSLLERRPCSISSSPRRERKYNDSSPSCEPSFVKRLIHRSCEVVKARTD